jgi:hypothetical protein
LSGQHNPLGIEWPSGREIWPWEQNDAGSGRDAPNTPVPEVWIASGQVYHGTLGGPFTTDHHDYYAFETKAGDIVQAKLRGQIAQIDITDRYGQRVSTSSPTLIGNDVKCPPMVVSIEQDGLYYLRIYFSAPQQYLLLSGINEAAPEPGWLGQPLPPSPPIP